jgi:hypothetical protein
MPPIIDLRARSIRLQPQNLVRRRLYRPIGFTTQTLNVAHNQASRLRNHVWTKLDKTMLRRFVKRITKLLQKLRFRQLQYRPEYGSVVHE